MLKRKFFSVDKPLKRAFEKYKPRGLFQEFYGNSLSLLEIFPSDKQQFGY